MRSETPVTRDLVLVGGGHSHAVLLRMWGMNPLAGARVTLINPAPTAPYTGMLPGYVAGHYPREALEIDLVRLAQFAGARIIFDRAVGFDRAARRVRLADRPEIAYDLASINIGITSPIAGEGEGGAVPAKPLDAFADAWDAFIARVATGEAAPRAVVVGAGVGGGELALAMNYRLRNVAPDPSQVAVILIEQADVILPQVAARARARLSHALAAAQATVITGSEVVWTGPSGVRLADGRAIEAAFTAMAAGARAAGWLAQTGLALENGFVRVDPCLRSVSDEAVFAAGDIAHFDARPLEKAGVYAVRAGKTLYGNLRAALSDRPLRKFHPQKDYLKLVSLGGKRALAEKWGVALSGAWVWNWKDRIDRRFMRRHSNPPVMRIEPARPRGAPAAAGVAELEAAQPLCGGCGSKVGVSTLRAGLAGLAQSPRADVLRGAGDDAAVLSATPDGAGSRIVLSTDHFKAFTRDPYELARIAAVHAMGDVWAMGARPQAALANIVLPPMNAAKQSETLKEILDGAARSLSDAGAALVGGHTSNGAELIVGFTVTGVLGDASGIGLDGARAGDLLVLTKPVGVGVLLAGEMQGKTPGKAYGCALEQMRRSSANASTVLASGAHAMTDVTGFGLAGHLVSILERSGVSAHLDLDAVPWAEGAVELARSGVRSSIFPENLTAAGRMTATEETRADPRFDLLFDPQTSGGLLAALAPHAARRAVALLMEAGESGAIIGEVVEPSPDGVRLAVSAAHTR